MSNQSFFGGTGVTNNQTDAIEASVNNAAASEAAALASKNTATAQATTSTTKAEESAASAAAALVSKNSASSSSSSALTSKNSATASASAASGSAGTASTKASEALSSANTSTSSRNSSITAKNESVTAKNASVVAKDASIVAKDASVAAKDLSVSAKNDSVTAKDASVVAKDASVVSKNAAAASAASALSNKNSSDTNSATATTKASQAASSATAAASSATASASSESTSTASKNAAVAVTANYLGAHSSAPTQTAAGGALAVGMLYFDTTLDVLKVRASGGFINAGSSINGTSARFAYNLSANQTTVSGNDLSGNSLQFDAPFCDVFLNGVKLAAADMNISSGTSVVLAAGATAGDILEVVAFGTFQLNNGSFTGTTTVQNLAVSGTATATTQAAGNDTTRLATTAFTQAAITALVGSVPATLDTLAELGDALGDNPNYATTTSNLIGTKMPKAGGTFTGDVSLGDNKKVIFGDGSDLKIYHSGSHSIIDNTFGGLFFNQWVDDADITFQNDNSTGGTTTYMLMQGSTGEVQLRHYGSTKISTKASGVEVAGNMVVSGTVDGVDIATRDAVLTSTTTTANAALPKAGGALTGNVTLGDNNKAIFGTGSDFEIYFNGNHGVIRTASASVGGNIYIQDDNNIVLGSIGGENYLNAAKDGAVTLYYDNAPKLATTSTGIDVTGTATVDGLTVDGGTYHKVITTFPSTYLTNLQIGQQGSISNAANTDTITFAHSGAEAASDFLFTVNNSTKLTISGNGKIKIGNNIPMWSGSYGGALFLKGNNATGDRHAQITTVDSAGASTGTGLIVKGAGTAINVGIGTAAPLARLNILGDTNTFDGMAKIYLTDSNSNSASRNWSIGNGGSGHGNLTFAVSAAKDGNAGNATAVNAMNITSLGEVKINHTSTLMTALNPAMLQVKSAADRNGCKVEVSNTNYVAYGSGTSVANNYYFGFMANSSNVQIGSIYCTTSGVTYATTSDRRLKDNIQPIADATDKLMAMKPVTHTWIADPEADAVHGFIAQEMQEIVPEAISGDADSEEMMSMDYGRITPVLVAALQEATNEIKALKQRVSELEES